MSEAERQKALMLAQREPRRRKSILPIMLILLIVIFLLGKFTSRGGDHKPILSQTLKDQIATGINLNGNLCAKVIDVQPRQLKDTYEVTCIEYRGGSGKVRYNFNAANGTAFRN